MLTQPGTIFFSLCAVGAGLLVIGLCLLLLWLTLGLVRGWVNAPRRDV